MFDINEIATLSGYAVDDVRTLMPSLLSSIRGYTNRSFITTVGIVDTMVITDYNKITTQNSLFEGFSVGDNIEIRYSMNNLFIYTIKEISGDKTTITTFEKLYAEEVYSVVIKLSFPIHNSVVADMLRYKKSSETKIGVTSESLDGYSYTLDASMPQGYPKQIMSQLNYLKQLPGSTEREYRKAGYDVYTLEGRDYIRNLHFRQ